MRVFGNQLSDRAGSDEGLKARLDVLDSVPGGPDYQLGAVAG